MMAQDYFSQWLGIQVESVSPGNCRLSLTLRKEMLNGFGIAHGGIAFSLADSALAFASNSHNRKSLVIETSMSFTAPAREGDVLTAEAEEVNLTGRTGIYYVTVTDQENKKLAVFKGIVFRKPDHWFPDAE
ncbi:MAG: hydroxyphenylacetyl-CoA thioesterase PaaI [Bacteroidetes bacterium]|nr:hydroxyphenylacetyl-CoA thioesterase PaaI [Bacteroidota bacterium]